MSPQKQNTMGKNLCSGATPGCIASCLFTAGRGKFDMTKVARLHKTEYFLRERELFLQHLVTEITKGYKKHGTAMAVRLNGTSDIPYENIKIQDNKNIFELFPDVQFYDYTKSFERLTKKLPDNYHLTFSYAETAANQINAITALEMGFNVAAVFNVKKDSDLPTEYKGYTVVNGDEHDLTFIQPKGTIIGLRAKGEGKKDTTGFVIQL